MIYRLVHYTSALMNTIGMQFPHHWP